MRTLSVGGNLTDAATAAGFASSAHLSSTFKRMFGLSPSDIRSLGVTIDLSEDEVLAKTCVQPTQGEAAPARRLPGAHAQDIHDLSK